MYSTEDQEREYATRVCWLIMTVGTDVVRKKLDGIYGPGTGRGTLDEKLNLSSTVNKLNSLKAFHGLDLSRLYPSTGVIVSSRDFDISLLIRLLRNICSLPKPKGGWDNLPVSMDKTLSDDLARIKYYRNKIAHNEKLRLTENNFNTYWKELSEAFIRLGGTPIKTKIDSLLKEPLTQFAYEAKRELNQWFLKDLEVNMKFDVQLQKLEEMCNRIEENRNSKDFIREVRDLYTRLAEEITKTADAKSMEQIGLHQLHMEAVGKIGERLHNIEKSMTRSRQIREDILFVWHILTFSLFAVVSFVYYNSRPKQILLLFVLITFGTICLHNCKQQSSGEKQIHTRSSLRSLTDHFIGRGEDIRKITESLQAKKLVVVRAPYGFGTSEVVVAVGHQFNITTVIHVDMFDMAPTMSGKIITLLGLKPLPNTITQLKTVCPNLKSTLFILDNVDYIFGNEKTQFDFEYTIEVLTDDNICRGMKILCATQQTYRVFRELGIEHRLSSLSSENSTKLLITLCPKLSTNDATKLAVASMGIPLAIHLIKDLYISGHKPDDILSGIDEDIGNIAAVVGLEAKKELIAITLHYIRSQKPKVQDALKALSFVFSGSFDEFAARALIPGSKFVKQDILTTLNGSSLVFFDNLQERFSIHPFYRKLVKDRNMTTADIKQTSYERYAEYFIQVIHKASILWFSKYSMYSSYGITILRSEQHNIFNLFKMSIHNGLHVNNRSSMQLLLDLTVVNTLHEFFDEYVLFKFYSSLQDTVTVLDDKSSIVSLRYSLDRCLDRLIVKRKVYYTKRSLRGMDMRRFRPSRRKLT